MYELVEELVVSGSRGFASLIGIGRHGGRLVVDHIGTSDPVFGFRLWAGSCHVLHADLCLCGSFIAVFPGIITCTTFTSRPQTVNIWVFQEFEPY